MILISQQEYAMLRMRVSNNKSVFCTHQKLDMWNQHIILLSYANLNSIKLCIYIFKYTNELHHIMACVCINLCN